jgi:hypothetical protein
LRRAFGWFLILTVLVIILTSEWPGAMILKTFRSTWSEFVRTVLH